MPKPRSLENWVIIRVWISKSISEGAGHVSLQTPRHYISVWPSPDLSRADILKDTLSLEGSKKQFHSLADDYRIKGKPSLTVCLYSLAVENIEFYFEEILEEKLKSWAINGDLCLTGKISFFKTHMAETYIGVSQHSCASLIYSLLVDHGGIKELFPRKPLNDGRYFSLKTTRAMKAVAIGAIPTMALGASSSLASLPLLGIAKITENKETEKRALRVACSGFVAGAALVSPLAYDSRTSENDSLPQNITETGNNLLENPQYVAALAHFKYPSDALEIHVKTPEDLEKIVCIAKYYETALYPETVDFPNDHETLGSLLNFLTNSNKVSYIMTDSLNEKLALNFSGLTSLQAAIQDNAVEEVKKLWEQYPRERARRTGKELFGGYENCLHLAVRNPPKRIFYRPKLTLPNRAELIEFLISRNYFDINESNYNYLTPLLLAIQLGNKEVVLVLMGHGSNPFRFDKDYNNAIHLSVIQDNVELLDYFWKNFSALRTSQANAGKTILHIAVNKPKSVNYILEHIAEEPSLINAKDHSGKTPIFYAVSNSQLELIKILEAHGANLDVVTNNGATLLHECADTNKIEATIMQHLISKGLKVNAQNNYGNTPLHHAVRSKNLSCVRYLASIGADLCMKNNFGELPINIAPDEIRSEVINIFCEYGYNKSCTIS